MPDDSKSPALAADESQIGLFADEHTPARNAGMKLIPWSDIWGSLSVARVRGQGEMIEVFYNTLFRDAIFDDNGAWAFDAKSRA